MIIIIIIVIMIIIILLMKWVQAVFLVALQKLWPEKQNGNRGEGENW